MSTLVFDKLTNSNLLVKNAVWNILGQTSPMIIAIFTIPTVIRGIGTERFGILTLIWMLIGYAGLFDFGLGRAMTQAVSQKLGKKEVDDIPALIRTGLVIAIGFGIIGAIIIAVLAPWISTYLLKVSKEYIFETICSTYFLAFCLPFLIATVCFKAVLESYQQFAVTNLIRVPLALFNYIGPLLILPFSSNLVYIVGILVLGRIITCITHYIVCRKVINNLFSSISIDKNIIKPLLRFGGWMTVSNILSPFMSYMDRFFIANLISVGLVAYYTTPFEVITKVMFVPWAIMGVMFPAFSSEFVRDREKMLYLYNQSMKYIFFLLIIPVIGITILAKPVLGLWISSDFAGKSYVISQILAVGVLMASLSQVSSGLIQAIGRSDITAKWHLIEFPVFIVSIFFFLKLFGLIGAPLIWLIRVSLDYLFMGFMVKKLVKKL